MSIEHTHILFEITINMDNQQTLTMFDQLATEILLDIFDYLSCNDIIYTFFYFNQRINSLLLHHQR
jgi:hypothetical protein